MHWVQDLRFAMRMMRKQPWFSAAIVVTLAFGIGVNTTVFSLVNAVLYKPLPFAGGERLAVLFNHNRSNGRDQQRLSYPDFREFQSQQKTFEALEGIAPESMSISEKGNPPERFNGARITPGLFDMLRVQPVLGRGLTAADVKPGATEVAIIGYGMWKDRYGKDTGIAGRVVRINEKPVVIAGVMQEGFKFPSNEDMWMPLIPNSDWEKRERAPLMGIGILKPGVSIPQANADLNVIAQRLQKEFPKTNKDLGAMVKTFHQTFNGGPIRLVFLLMLGAVGFVLLIACANVANMMLSRAVSRSREVSIRAAMGASRWRIIRQLLIESVLLSIAGGLLGLFMARFGVEGFSAAVSNVGKPYWIDFTMDYTVFVYFTTVSVLAGILFGLAPAWHSSKVDLNETLKEGGRTVGTLRGGLVSSALVVFQFTLAMVLLSGAGLMMRSFLEHQNENKGIPAEKILTARVSLPTNKYPKPEDRLRFFEQLIDKLRTLPGVESAGLVSNFPGTGAAGWRFEVEGRPVEDPAKRPAAAGVVAFPGYFQAINVAIRQGRDFEPTDGLPGKEAAIVSEGMVARFWPKENPLGRRLRTFKDDGTAEAWMTVVGVIPDLRQNNPVDEKTDPLLFLPYRQQSWGGLALLVRTQMPPAQMTQAVRLAVQGLDEDMPLFQVGSLMEMFQRGRWHWRVFGTLFLIFAGIALMMAAVGIYAVMANATMRRTQEIGVRVAMGADVGSILRMVMGRGVKQLAVGMVLGLAAALGVCQLMSGILFKVSPRDPLTFTTVAAVLGLAGMLACWLPARRAAALDPVKALRYE